MLLRNYVQQAHFKFRQNLRNIFSLQDLSSPFEMFCGYAQLHTEVDLLGAQATLAHLIL